MYNLLKEKQILWKKNLQIKNILDKIPLNLIKLKWLFDSGALLYVFY
jgi:hypothetical protein